MKKYLSIFFVVFIMILLPVTVRADKALDLKKIQKNIEEGINDTRLNNNLKALNFNDKDMQARADQRAQECAGLNKITHTRPNGDWGPTIIQKKYNRGENLATVRKFPSKYDEKKFAEMVVNGWMKSQAHREVILDETSLNCNFTTGAVGIIKTTEGGKDVYYIVLLVRDK